ncbi:MAG: hypothetical protein COS85_16230 [Armatimonadetes bacterium CG07_land_8_20_14_0_80_59_28]|nr:MAG: hypothetical protein COS85_16230 [Armatimonadetes bacterium CG07_land_8_20_14_0_80_59_28]PJB64387.1 MAG: hypothetical protein CO095_14965 [Armatimonadetes bacterium CG_4_9_14_3_um_filter_58_7]
MMATASEARAEHLERFQLSDATIVEVGGTPNLPPDVITAYRALGAGLTASERSCGASEAAYMSKSVNNDIAGRALWRDLSSWYLIASVSAPEDNSRAALKMIDTSTGYSALNLRIRADQTLGALTEFPDDFSVNGKTTIQWEAAINAYFASEAEERGLEAGLTAARESLKKADRALDKENKRIYKILKASFPKGSREYEIITRIPTMKYKTPAAPTEGLPEV